MAYLIPSNSFNHNQDIIQIERNPSEISSFVAESELEINRVEPSHVSTADKINDFVEKYAVEITVVVGGAIALSGVMTFGASVALFGLAIFLIGASVWAYQEVNSYLREQEARRMSEVTAFLGKSNPLPRTTSAPDLETISAPDFVQNPVLPQFPKSASF